MAVTLSRGSKPESSCAVLTIEQPHRRHSHTLHDTMTSQARRTKRQDFGASVG